MHKVSEVVLSHDAYMVCMQHVHTTDGEEVMGLLVGSYIQSESDEEKDEQNVTCDVTHAVILRRSDKRKDRVEIPPEMLIQAQQKAEEISKTSKTSVNIVGWYHSHPKITVAPSAVDLQTQMGYQQMDHRFVGVIFSVFNKQEASKIGKVVIGGFQAAESQHGGDCERIDLPVTIRPGGGVFPHNQEALVGLSKTLLQEQLAVLDVSRDQHAVNSPLLHLHNSAVSVQRMAEVCEQQLAPLCAVVASRVQHLAEDNDNLEDHINYLTKLLHDHHFDFKLQL